MHPLPALLTETLHAHAHLWGRYPPVSGTPAFREAVCAWLARRYGLPAGALDPELHVLPVAGTKEALFLIAQAVVPERKAGRRPAVLMPNPFYNVYLGGAVFAGAEPVLLPVSAATGYLPALDELRPDLLARTAAFYLCTPANPQGLAADAGLPAATGRARPRAQFPAGRRRVLLGDLQRRAAARRARRRRWRWTAGSTTCWSATRSPSARARPGCARASSPAIPR